MRKMTPITCPICGRKYRTTKPLCRKCGSELSEYYSLSDQNALFVLPLIKHRGSINTL